MKSLIVIPARWNSQRLPGKPLQFVAGRSLLERTINLARRATRAHPMADIVVATDDRRIVDAANGFGCAAVMTDPALSSGSARALAASASLAYLPDHIINLQGDAPFLPVQAITHIAAALADGAEVATPVLRLDWTDLDGLRAHKLRTPFSGTTCTIGAAGRALWFSKQIIPMIRDEASARASSALSPVYRHLGLYGYTRSALERFQASQPSRYEQLEGLEQLRLLEMGIAIHTVEVERPLISLGGIDTMEDVKLAEQLILQHGDPYGT